MKKLIFFALLMVFLALPFASALTGFEPVKNYDDSTQTVTIQNTFLFIPTSEVGRVTLLNNTESCGGEIQCSADMKLVLNQDYQVPLSNIEMTLPDKVTPYHIENYEVYIQNGTKSVNITDTGQICNSSINGTISCIVGDVGSHFETRNDYRVFNEGESLNAGTYYFKLIGKKNPYDSIEWIPTFLNFKIEEWAVWGPTTLMVNRTSGSTTAASSAIGSYKYSAYKFNATANFTLRAVQIYGTGLSGSVTMRAGLFTNNASNQPNSTQIGNWSDANITAVNNVYQNFTWSKNDTNVTQNKIYWIVFDPLGTANFIRVGEHGGTPTIFICTAGDLDHWGNTCGGSNFDGMNIDIYGAIQGSVTLNSPINNSNYSALSPTVVFNASMTPAGSNVNETLYIWNSTSTIFNQTTNTLTGTGTNSTTWNVSIAGYADGNYLWNVYGCDTSACIWANNNFTFIKDTTAPNVNIIIPLNNQTVANEGNISLNYSVTDALSSIGTCWYSLDSGANVTIASCVNTTFATTVGDHQLNFWANDTLNNINMKNVNFSVVNITLSPSVNSPVLENSTNNFGIVVNASNNVTQVPIFFYNNTAYTSGITNSTSGSLTTYNISVQAPYVGADSVNIPYFWSFNMTYKGTTSNINQTSANQAVTRWNWIQCGGYNSTGSFSLPGNYNVTYLNITFKDEISLANINATIASSTWTYNPTGLTGSKTYSYSNSTHNPSYGFCGYPSYLSITNNVSINYASTQSATYPQRNYIPLVSPQIYTNATTNLVLYLLSSTSGQYVTFQVLNVANQPLQGVSVNAQETLGGIPTTICAGTTDAAGSITCWMNPIASTTMQFSKSGYDSLTNTITPSQTSYTVIMNSLSSSNVTDYGNGVSYTVLPASPYLANQTNYNFNISLASTVYTITAWGYNITNSSGFVFASNSSTANGGFLSSALNTGLNRTFQINAYYNISNSTVYFNKVWVITNVVSGGYSISNLFTDFNLYLKNGGFFGIDAFGINLIVFLIIFSTVGIMSFKFGIYSPASIAGLAFAETAFFDVGLGLITPPAFLAAVPNVATVFMGIAFLALAIKEATGY